MDEHEHEDEDAGAGGSAAAAAGVATDLLRSYLAFGKRALARNWMLSAGIFVAIASLTIVVAKFWPRTYHCEARLMSDQNDVFAAHGAGWGNGLRGASNVISRHENLEAIIKRTDLVHVSAARRPFVLQVKDRLLERLGGKMSDEDAARTLVWTLEGKLTVDASDQALTIGVDWADPQTSALLVQAALDNFLDSRHVAEISAIAEYISILEGHATTLRSEVETLAAQIEDQRKQKRTAAAQKLKASRKAAETAAPTAPVIMRRTMEQVLKEDDSAPGTKVVIEAKRQMIKELEAERNQKLRDLQSRKEELLLKYTAAHPIVESLQQQIVAISNESPQVAALRKELADLEAQQPKFTTSTKTTTIGGAPRPAAPADANGQLPEEIMNLLNTPGEEIDPALGAQFGYAVAKFSTLRSQISESRIELDTAQAAFNHRYKVVSPPEPPAKPIKPKVPMIVAVGLIAGLLISVVAAIGLELREGKLVEQWQVQQLALPVLAELQFPPSTTND